MLDDLISAFGYWVGYVMHLEAIACAGWPDECKWSACDLLNSTHNAAANALMKESVRQNLDPAPLWECDRVIQEVYREDPTRVFQRGNYDTWPECMGKWRYDLPEGQQKALRDGEAAFIRLFAALDLVTNEGENGGTQAATIPSVPTFNSFSRIVLHCARLNEV